jgi:rubrerythrin
VDLGLARRLAAEEKPVAGMSYQQILSAAIKKEERSGDLYRDLAAAAVDGDIRMVFERLAAEESRHKHYFEELYENEVARDN